MSPAGPDMSLANHSVFSPKATPPSTHANPGKVAALHGVIFQCDASSVLGDIFIRPAEALDLWFTGFSHRHSKNIPREQKKAPLLGMHAGLHVELADGRHFVVEQLAGTWRNWLVDGLHWTPLEEFQGRERRDQGGWDVTIPAEQFRQVDPFAVNFAVTHLNSIRGRPFLNEDCTGFIGRVVGQKRRIFADSPILRWLGFDYRSGEPALPLLHHDAVLPPEAETRMRGAILRRLPDPAAESASLSLRQLHHRFVFGAVFCCAISVLAFLFFRPKAGPNGVRE